MSSGYSQEMINLQNQRQMAPFSEDNSIYKQLQQGFQNSLQSAANERANQDLKLHEQAQSFGQEMQKNQFDLENQRFQIYKNLQTQMQPIQVRQANINADLAQTNLDAAPALQDAKKQAALKQIDSQTQIQHFGTDLGSMSNEEFQNGEGDNLLEQYAPKMTHSDYLQAQDILNQKKNMTGVAAAQAARAKNIQDQMSLAPALGYNDIHDPEFQQAYRNFKKQELISPEGSMIRRDPKTGIITMSRPGETFARGGKGSVNGLNQNQFNANFRAAYDAAFKNLGDHKKALQAAREVMIESNGMFNQMSGNPSATIAPTPTTANSVFDNLK